jgi:hypothetical protein
MPSETRPAATSLALSSLNRLNQSLSSNMLRSYDALQSLAL